MPDDRRPTLTDVATRAGVSKSLVSLVLQGSPRVSEQRRAAVLDKVGTKSTLGDSVDVLVTQRGIAVNPRHEGLREQLEAAGMPVKDIHALRAMARETIAMVNDSVTAYVRQDVALADGATALSEGDVAGRLPLS